MSSLLKRAGTLPFLAAVFLNAFVDLGHKIVIQNTVFKVYDGQTQVVLTALVNGLILLPFILLLSPAGFLSDKYPKALVMKRAAWAAVLITLAITACYYLGWFWPAFALTFLLAAQSAFYSPAKYGYIKPLFGKEQLSRGNGLVQAISIVAILAGTLAYSIVFEVAYPGPDSSTEEILRAIAPIGWLLVLNSVIELAMMYRLRELEPGEPTRRFDWAAYRRCQMMRDSLAPLRQRRVIRLAVIGLATFWSVGQVMLAAFPAFTKEQFGVTNTILLQAILASAGVGIALGSALAGRWSRAHIETGLIPVGALGIALGLWILPQVGSPAMQALAFLGIGVMGGLFIVPLNALIQFHAGEHEMGKVLAASNWVQNVAMTGFLVLTALFALAGVESRWLLVLIALVAVAGGAYTVYTLPQSLVRFALSYVMSRRYRISVQGLRNLPGQGGVLLLGNHISWIDWAIVQVASPRPLRFVMDAAIYNRWYLRGLLRLMGCIPIAPGASSRGALEQITALLNAGEAVCLFPEGAISRSGHLGIFRQGYERACAGVNESVVIVPFYLRGLWGSQFSRASGQLKASRSSGLHRELIVAFGAPLPASTQADVLKREVFELSITAWARYADTLPTLPAAWIDAVKRRSAQPAIADSRGVALSACQALATATLLARQIAGAAPDQARIGLLVGTSADAVLAHMAALMCGRTVVHLSPDASPDALQTALTQTGIRSVFSTRAVMETLRARRLATDSTLHHCALICLDELRDALGPLELRSRQWLVRCLPAGILKARYCRARDAGATAAVLFTRGGSRNSRDMPRGVMLSHRNIMANLKQIAEVLNAHGDDVMLATLPMSHALGLTVTQLMPLMEGLPLVCHADATDAVGIARACAEHRATLLCTTPGGLQQLTEAAAAHPLMLASLRLVVVGGAPLAPALRETFEGRFKKDVFEGYGTTETTPVASVNLPDALDTRYWQVQRGSRPGSVGMPLPGTAIRIVDRASLEALPTGSEGRVMIGGAQVMQGYVDDARQTAAVIHTVNGSRWFLSDDRGYLDADGFLTLTGRC